MSSSPLYKQNKIQKVDISLKQLVDIDTTNALYNNRLDNIRDNQVLVSGTNKYRQDVFRFKYLTDLIVAGSGVTITSLDGVLTISSTGGGGGGVTSIDVDGGTGISVSPAGPITTSGVFTVTNTAPDQTVVLNNGTGISVTGTYPNFTINATGSGGGGLPYGVASGTNTYTVTISGAAYVAGNAYIISFTNGNDADSTININGLGAKLLVKEFDVQLTGGDIVSGQDLIIIYDGTNFQTLGVAPNQLFAYVTNDDSVTITKGQPVYAFGAAGNRMSVKLALNTSDATSAQTVGLVYSSSIAPNQRGFIITQGVISGVNTAAYSPGDTLYLGSTAGSLTATKPFAPNHLVYIGVVERANAGNGQIYVKPQNGYEMNELHDVQSNAAVNNDILYRDTTVSPNLWKPASISTILGYTPANIASPAFTGNPTAPTPPSGDNDTSIATTAFVQNMAIQSATTISIFGDGANGAATITGAITLVDDAYYTDLTIGVGGSINLRGYRLFVNGVLDLSNAGANAIFNNGLTGNSGTVTAQAGVRGGIGVTVSGYGNAATSIAISGAGGAGSLTNNNNAVPGAAPTTIAAATRHTAGGAAGAGGGGGSNSLTPSNGAAGGAGQATLTVPVAYFVRTYIPGMLSFFISRTIISQTTTTSPLTTIDTVGGRHGGGGGGGGASPGANGKSGGSGGSGGGLAVIYARQIIVGASTNAAAISARGGNGGAGGTSGFFGQSGGGGGGGGGGGYVYLVYGTITGGSFTFVTADGGAGGNGSNGNGDGGNPLVNGTGTGGTGGTGGNGGRITAISLGGNTITQVDGTGNAAATPTVPTTTAGSAGTAGGTCTFSS